MLRAMAALAALGLVASCGQNGAEPEASDGLAALSAAICDAVQAAGHPATAASIFYNRAHESLHTLARGLESVDRAAAGEVLQAKERVEADLRANPVAPALPIDLRALSQAANRGLAGLTQPAPPCP